MNGKIAGIYLAAGESRRMGCDKLSLPLGDTALGSMALHSALRSELDYLIVVTRPKRAAWLEMTFHSPAWNGKWKETVCRDAMLGHSHSLRCGLMAAHAYGAAGALILLADQPFISSWMINRLITAFHHSDQTTDYIAAAYAGLPRPPVLFAASVFSELMKLEGDTGARHLLRGGLGLKGNCIPFHDSRLFLDVDTPEAYRRASSVLQTLTDR